MRRRLRKKKRLGEFIELGFLVRIEFVSALDDLGCDAFLDRWIDAVEARGLVFGGGGRREAFEGFVTGTGRASATDADRAAMAAFCANDSAVVCQDVGPLVDAWR
jgi:uncharacterized protein YggL (DUF469 family)